MHYKSFFPEVPEVPESNVHHLLFDRPDQREWPDYTLFVDVNTGQRRSFREFIERVRDGASALGADIAQGGLGLCPKNGDLVGILSENCLVCSIYIFISSTQQGHFSGLHHAFPFTADDHSSRCDVFILLYAARVRTCDFACAADQDFC